MHVEFNHIIDALPGLVWTVRPDGHVDFVNKRWCDYTGHGLDEAHGSGWQSAIHLEDLPELLKNWQSLPALGPDSGEPRGMEVRLRRFDGQYRWFHFQSRPLADPTGRIIGWCGIGTDIDDRKRDEEELLAVETNYRKFVQSFPGLVVTMSLAGEVQLFSREVLEFFGKTPEELKHWADGDAVHPDDLPRVIAAFKNSVATGNPYSIEHRCRRADGIYRWFQVRALPVKDAGGSVTGWYVLLTDITERQQSINDRNWAEALLAGEKQLLEMIGSGRSLPAVLNAACTFVEKASVPCHCGFYPIDWSGPTFHNAVAPSLPASYTAPIEGLPVRYDIAPCGIAAFEKMQVIVEDIETDPRWSGSSYQAHVLSHGLRSVWSTPITSKEGRVLGTFCIYQRKPGKPSSRQLELMAQVTHIASIAIERSQAEAALRRNEALLAEGQRLSLTGTFSWCVATDEIVWSDQSYRILEVDPAKPLTFDLINTRIHPEDAPAFNAHVQWARHTGDDFDFMCRLLLPDRSVKHVQVVAHGARNRNGHLEYIGAIQDVTQRRLSDDALSKARSELARVVRMTSLGALTASIAHEVNQPLSGIITNASTCLRMLAADPPNVEGARETAKRTIRDGNRASDVITRLRALFSKKEITMEPLDLNEAAREVIALSLSDLQRKRVILRAEFSDGLPPAMGDRVQLQQVILNLLLNAAEAMSGVDGPPRHLVIRTRREDGDCVRLSVQDTGVGLDPQAMDKLFEAFYTTKPDGMGIGLSVSRSIIERHHGRLWATPNDGPGATFWFSIPCIPGGELNTRDFGGIHMPDAQDAEQVVRSL